MSIASQLADHVSKVDELEREIQHYCRSISPEAIANDPAFQDDLVESNLNSALSIYQLNQKQKDLENAQFILDELFLIRALFSEIETGFDPFNSGSYVCDLDELRAFAISLEKAEDKVSELSLAKVVIFSSLESQLADFRSTFVQKLEFLFDLFFPTLDTVNASITINEATVIQLSDYVDFCNTRITRVAGSYLNEKFKVRKKAWEEDQLVPLISKESFLRLDIRVPMYSLTNFEVATTGPFLPSFLTSLLNFVLFINVIDVPSLKQFFSTAISNALVDAVSENIESFMVDEEQLTAQLLNTVKVFTQTGWPMPLRNVFVSHEKIQESLQMLYLNWLNDRYINEIRAVFSEPLFLSLLAEIHLIEEEIVLAPAPVLAAPSAHLASVSANKKSSQDTISEIVENAIENEHRNDDWNEAWSSDLDQEGEIWGNEQKGEGHEDEWDESWGDGWDDEPVFQSRDAKPAKLEIAVKQKEAVPKPDPTLFVNEDISRVAEPLVEKQVCYRSAVVYKLSSILSKYDQDSRGATPQLLLDGILSLALVTYPPLTQLFLLLNDLSGLGSEYLARRVGDEWLHTKQTLFSETLTLVTEIMECCDSDRDFEVDGGIDKVSDVVDGLFKGDLFKSNPTELKELLLQYSNLINTLAVDQILSNSDISEHQSECYTKFLRGLQALENNALSKVGESVIKLASWPRVDQVTFLLNHHLKEIMRYFYESKLYACTTEELEKVIQSVFVPSELREQCIKEVLEIRNTT